MDINDITRDYLFKREKQERYRVYKRIADIIEEHKSTLSSGEIAEKILREIDCSPSILFRGEKGE